MALYYHVTPTENVLDILSSGLSPRTEGKTYLFADPFYAEEFAESFHLEGWGGRTKEIPATDWTILEIENPPGRLYRDKEFDPEGEMGSYYIKTSIPANRIRTIRRFEVSG